MYKLWKVGRREEGGKASLAVWRTSSGLMQILEDSTKGKLPIQYILSYHNIDITSGTYHGQLSLSQKTRCVASIIWSRFVQWAGGLRRALGPGACTQDLVCPGQICCKVQWTPFNQLFSPTYPAQSMSQSKAFQGFFCECASIHGLWRSDLWKKKALQQDLIDRNTTWIGIYGIWLFDSGDHLNSEQSVPIPGVASPRGSRETGTWARCTGFGTESKAREKMQPGEWESRK